MRIIELERDFSVLPENQTVQCFVQTMKLNVPNIINTILYQTKFIPVIFFIIIALISTNTSCQDFSKYNLDFRSESLNDFQWKIGMRYLQTSIDRSESINGKYPLCLKQHKKDSTKNDILPEPLVVSFSKQFLIPDFLYSDSDTGIIDINNKCLNINEIHLKLFGLDQNDNIIYSDSININNDNCWKKSSLIFSLKRLHKIHFGIYGFGGNPFLEQKIWLDRIHIFIKDHNIEQLTCLPLSNEAVLGKENAIALSFDDYSGYDKINDWKDKKIIGLGESIHGSHTVAQSQIQVMKYLIENQHCRLILYEADMYSLLYYNLFIHGKIQENKIEEIKNELPLIIYDPTVFSDFLLWLREYNLKNEDRVQLCGLIDFEYKQWMYPLFDYLYAFYTNQADFEIYPVLKDIYENNLLHAWERASNSDKLKQIMGLKDYMEFLKALKAAFDHIPQNISPNAGFQAIFARDYSMYLNADSMISRLKENEKAVIVAHDLHVNKKTAEFPYLYSMGFYLNQKYGGSYFPIGIYVGKGAISSRKLGNNIDSGSIRLDSPIVGSVEDKCTELDIPYFYYSSKFLTESDWYFRSIGQAYINSKDQIYNFGPLKERINGIFFINKSETIESNGSLSERYSKVFFEKVKTHADTMKKIESLQIYYHE